MIIHNDPFLSIYFGDARQSFPRELCMADSQQELELHDSIKAIKKRMHLDSLLFLKQTHSVQGVLVTQEIVPKMFMHKEEGDYLVTSLSHTGLGVYTADCLPIVFYDSYTHAIGIAHAGWPGSIGNIAVKTVQAMEQRCGTKVESVQVFFGPSAKVCCYEVGPDFVKHLEHSKEKDKVLLSRAGKLCFDLPLFNKLQLEAYGVKKEAFHCSYNICTIGNESFCSYRRQGSEARRQLTIVALKYS